MKRFSFLVHSFLLATLCTNVNALCFYDRPAHGADKTTAASRPTYDFFKGIDVFSGWEVQLPGETLFPKKDFIPYAEQDHAEPDPISGKATASCKVVFSRLTAFGAAKSDAIPLTGSTAFFQGTSLFSAAAMESLQTHLSYTYGAKLHLGSERSIYTADLLAGTLRFSQAVSRLKDPRLSPGTALRRPVELECGMAPELPTRSSAPSGPALSLRLSPALQQNGLPSLEAAYTSAQEPILSVYSSFSSHTLAAGNFCVTGGLFHFGNEGGTGWMAKNARFPESSFAAVEIAGSFTFPLFRTITNVGIHGAPFGKSSCWVKTQESLSLGPFFLGVSCFFCDEPLYTANGTVLRTTKQFLANMQYAFPAGPSLLRSGILFLVEFRLPTVHTGTPQRNSSGEEQAIYKCRADASLQLSHSTLSAHATFSYDGESEETAAAAGAHLSHSFKKASAGCTFSSEWSGTKVSYSGNASLSSVKNDLSTALSCTVSTKDAVFNSSSTSLSMTFHRSLKKLKFTIKAAFLLTF